MNELDIKKIYYFVEVAKIKSFTRASKNLFISQPMLSKAVSQIEEFLKVKLIDRSSKKFKLTSDGDIFYENAVKLIDNYHETLNIFSGDKLLRQGSVLISIPAVILSLYFPKFLMEFRAAYPRININIFEEGSKAVLESVRQENVDIGVLMLPVETTGLEVTEFIEDTCVIIMSKEHELSKGKAVISIEELKEEKFIIFNNRFVLHELIVKTCDSRGFSPNIIYQSSLDSFILNMVELNLGISILPLPLVKTYVNKNIVYKKIEPEIPWKLAMVVKRERYQSFAVREMLNRIKVYYSNEIYKWLLIVFEYVHDNSSNGSDSGNGSNGGSSSGNLSSGGTVANTNEPNEQEKTVELPEEDVPLGNNENADRIKFLLGYEDRSVKPENEILRREMHQIAFNLLEDSNKHDFEPTYLPKDVKPEDWFAKAVGYLLHLDMITTFEDDTIRHGERVKRGEVAALLSYFIDDSSITGEDQTTDRINLMILNGYIVGDEGGFRLDDYITRAEVAVLVHKVFDAYPDISKFSNMESLYIDLDKSHWAYAYILSASYTRADIEWKLD